MKSCLCKGLDGVSGPGTTSFKMVVEEPVLRFKPSLAHGCDLIRTNTAKTIITKAPLRTVTFHAPRAMKFIQDITVYYTLRNGVPHTLALLISFPTKSRSRLVFSADIHENIATNDDL